MLSSVMLPCLTVLSVLVVVVEGGGVEDSNDIGPKIHHVHNHKMHVFECRLTIPWGHEM